MERPGTFRPLLAKSLAFSVNLFSSGSLALYFADPLLTLYFYGVLCFFIATTLNIQPL
jgi:hypothetical protein